MLIKKPADIKVSEITDERIYRERRRFLRQAPIAALLTGAAAAEPAHALDLLGWWGGGEKHEDRSPAEEPTPYEDITRYNNFYEFGTDKESPARLAQSLRTRPWSVAVEGEVGKPAVYDLDDLLKPHTPEERIYRLRCVEAWSMVVPWEGIPLANVIKRLEPTSKAKYVELTTLYDPQQMPGQRVPVLDWPYVEGLRMDEAMHPLTLLAVGLYGKSLPSQNGAPLRLVVPWKYGFKSIKSIVRLRFTETQPATTWNRAAPREYGFYANVNPTVDHPRWSQARERRIGEFLKRDTLIFNGYADQVASLYAGMDLAKYF